MINTRLGNKVANPFGRKNGVLITVHDLNKETERGLKCGCECPNCKAPFEARMGDDRIWHFAHSGTPCNQTIAFVNCLYEMTYDAVISGSRIVLPPLFGKYICYSDYPENWYAEYDSFKREGFEPVFPGKNYTVTKAEYVKDGSGMTKAILLNDGQLALKVTAQKEYCLSENTSSYKDYPTIVIDLEDFVDKYNMVGLHRLIVENTRIKRWLKWESPEEWLSAKRRDAYVLLEQRKQQKAEEAKKRKEYEEKKESVRLAFIKQKKKEEEKEQEDHRKREEDFKRNMESNLEQQEKQVIDPDGNRWIKCRFCGKIAMTSEFWTYGGSGRINLGICHECKKNNPAVKEAREVKRDEETKKYDPTICPECGGKLKERSGRNGMFIGCSNYPKCRYTRSIKK